MTNTSLGSSIVAAELQVQQLLVNAQLVGGIFTMGFEECLVLTNDLWKKQAGGVPQHCFLLATAMIPGTAPDPEDEEVILLRVIGPAALPAEAQLVQVREEAMREMVLSKGREVAAAAPAILDVLTRNEIQFSGLRAKILGTFYDSEIKGRSVLQFGSDVETFYSASHYKVYKPCGKSMAVIASFPQATEAELQGGGATTRVRIGSVRFCSSSRRRRREHAAEEQTAVPVCVRVEDFVSMKTAVFGMTRLGKSNTMKTIATAVFQFAAETRQRIGQLLFDPAGEYANVNVQDETALSQIGPAYVTIFRYGADGSQPGVRPLSVNFFDVASIEVAWSIITSYLGARPADYIRSFLSADVVGPETEDANRREFLRAERRRAALYACFLKAGFQAPPRLTVSLVANKAVVAAINERLHENEEKFSGDNHGRLRLSAGQLTVFWDAILDAQQDEVEELEDWIDPDLQAILKLYGGSVGSGFRLLQPMRVYHLPTTSQDYAGQILEELVAGRIVIVDLSLGSETVLKFCSERIVNHLLQDAARRFAEGEDPHQIQIFIEEAHRLFNRDRMNRPEEADPYVRLAKEAAKYKIGLIYATQEVSTVDNLILSNTSNWVVTHLNNKAEVKELSKYYDFEDFSDLTLKSEDVGFARVKTRSGRYVIPTQIDLFSGHRVAEAQQAALRASTQGGWL